MGSHTLNQYVDGQLTRLSAAIGLSAVADRVRPLLSDLLGAATDWPLGIPKWPSGVADDHSPIEYSVAFAPDGSPTLRLVAECVADQPSAEANQLAALSAVASMSKKTSLSLDRFSAIAAPFLTKSPAAPFSMWFSLVAGRDSLPSLKVYLNPAARGRQHAIQLVSHALDQLGFSDGMDTIHKGLRNLSTVDRLSAFALDLDDSPASRAKVYVSHSGLSAADLRRAATVAAHGAPDEAVDFCTQATATDGPFLRKPLISAYTFLPGDRAVPSGYSVYVPIRDYVVNDVEALNRAAALSDRFGHSSATVRSAVDAVRGRELAAGRGLIAHLSLRTGPPRPGMTVYLSAEANGVTPARAVPGAA